jgi:hypothetical protein
MNKRMKMAASGMLAIAALVACACITFGSYDSQQGQPALVASAAPGSGLGQLQPAPGVDRRTGQSSTPSNWMPTHWNCRTCSVPGGDSKTPLWPKPVPRPLDAAVDACTD